MCRLSFASLVIAVMLVAACSVPAVTPTTTPEPSATVTPSPLAPAGTPLPDDVVSATPLPSGGEPLNPAPRPFAPRPGDERLVHATVFIDSAEVVVAESFPPNFFLRLTGSLPDPCHQLRVSVSAPNSQNRSVVEVYSLADPNTACIAVLQPFEVSVPLGSFPNGKYEVWVDSQPVGEIEAP